jgi:hypothetical protein
MQILKKWLNQLKNFFNKHFKEYYLASFCWWIPSSYEIHCTLMISLTSPAFYSLHQQPYITRLTWSACIISLTSPALHHQLASSALHHRPYIISLHLKPKTKCIRWKRVRVILITFQKILVLLKSQPPTGMHFCKIQNNTQCPFPAISLAAAINSNQYFILCNQLFTQ